MKKSINLVCPKCATEWGTLNLDEETNQINPDDIIDKISNKKFKDGDPLSCTKCGYKYTTLDMIYIYATHVKGYTDKGNEIIELYQKLQDKIKKIEKDIEKTIEGKNEK